MERGVQTGAHIGQEERRTCMAAIEVRHLYKRFEQKGVTVEALSDINLTGTTLNQCQAHRKTQAPSAQTLWYGM